MNWIWFFSTVAQAVGAIVGFFRAFIITKIVNNQKIFLYYNSHSFPTHPKYI